MGGRGSGRPSGHGLSVDKCHEFHSIDLALLRKRNLLRVGTWSALRWSRGTQETGSIKIAVVSQGIRLVYRRRERGEWQDVDEIVSLVETPARLGGSRQWFRCLSCQRRCRIIYGGGHFHCRRCHGLKYGTQYEPHFARAATAVLKIRSRLGAKGGIDDPFPRRPKGMHRRTYERLRDEEEQLQSAWVVGIMARFSIVEPT